MRQTQRMSAVALLTAEELERHPRDDSRYELVAGRLVRMSPVGFEHARVVARLISLLERFVRERDLGFVLPELGVKLASDPDTVRAPDVAFVRRDRIPTPAPRGFLAGAADMAIEVLSPDDRRRKVAAKIDEYLTAGTTLVLIVDPGRRVITAHRRLSPAVTSAAADAIIDLGDVVPGVTLRLGDVFDDR
jgi:Uma2 family endonuclease